MIINDNLVLDILTYTVFSILFFWKPLQYLWNAQVCFVFENKMWKAVYLGEETEDISSARDHFCLCGGLLECVYFSILPNTSATGRMW